MAYWLMKSEPTEFSIDDLKAKGKTGEPWDGIRNYQARNFMQDMKVGDNVLFYHSSCKDVGIVGQMTIKKEAYPDPAQFDESSKYFDAKATKDNPRWFLVDVAFKAKWQSTLSLNELKMQPELEGLLLLKQSRLSVMPISKTHWQTILRLADV